MLIKGCEFIADAWNIVGMIRSLGTCILIAGGTQEQHLAGQWHWSFKASRNVVSIKTNLLESSICYWKC